MQILTAQHRKLSGTEIIKKSARGTCSVFLPDTDHFSEVCFGDPEAPRVLRTISDEARIFQFNRILFEECPASLFYSEPYMKWYSGVLGQVFSDRLNRSKPVRFSELNRSFALRILSSEPAPDKSYIQFTLLLPPLWQDSTDNIVMDGGDMITDCFRESQCAMLCLLRPIGSGRWLGKCLQDAQTNGFRRILSPEAVL